MEGLRKLFQPGRFIEKMPGKGLYVLITNNNIVIITAINQVPKSVRKVHFNPSVQQPEMVIHEVEN